MIPRQPFMIVVEINIVLTLMVKRLAPESLQQIGKHVIDYLGTQQTLERKHTIAFQSIDALLHQLLPGIAVELMQRITIKIEQCIHRLRI